MKSGIASGSADISVDHEFFVPLTRTFARLTGKQLVEATCALTASFGGIADSLCSLQVLSRLTRRGYRLPLVFDRR